MPQQTPPAMNGHEGAGHDTDDVNISEWIAHAIADTGCTVVYGGHGGALVPLVDAVVAHPQLTWVCARNEHDAATMAAAHAKMTGGLGCVIATSGPGATNLVTGLLEATLDRCSLLAITGCKPTAVIGYSEFQDVNQARLFAGAGIQWSKDVASADAAIPLLRDAVATALTQRAAVHLAVPVDIQGAPSPLRLKHFCASHAGLRVAPTHVESGEILGEVAETLVGTPEERQPRNVLAVGLRATYGNHGDNNYNQTSDGNMSQALLDLAEALNAPVVTRLDAKGVVDESHPLSFGVIGVHGKPGLEAAASLISTADCIVSIGVEDETLLLTNSAGLQIRQLIEIQPDSLAIGTRFNAKHTLVGPMESTVRALTERVETLMTKICKKRQMIQAKQEQSQAPPLLRLPDRQEHYRRRSSFSSFGYMAYNNPKAMLRKASNAGSTDGDSLLSNGDAAAVASAEVTIPLLEELGEALVEEQTSKLWSSIHNSNWRRLAKFGIGGNYRFSVDKQHSEGYCHPGQVLTAVSVLRNSSSDRVDEVSRDAVVAVDVGDITLWASLCLHLSGNSRTLYSEHLGTMGYGLCAAVAGILSRPAPAGGLVLVGDGAFQMSLQELATFQQCKRPGDKLLVIVFDNELLGRVTFGFGGAAGCELKGPDYVALAEAYGGKGVQLNSDSDAEQVVERAMTAADGLYLIHVLVDPELKADMATFKDNALKVMNSG